MSNIRYDLWQKVGSWKTVSYCSRSDMPFQFKFLWRKGSLKHIFFVNKSSIYPEKTKSFKTKLPFKINFWATINEKGVFQMCHSRHDTSKEKRKSEVYIHIWRDQCLKLWNINKLTRLYLETLFNKNSY